jgi:hypothetical protein
MISDDRGANFETVVENVENTGLYFFMSWNYPDGDRYRIKVTATDTDGMMSEDISGNFTIKNYPSVDFLTQPKGDYISREFALYYSATDPYYNSEDLVIDIWLVEADGPNRILLSGNGTNEGVHNFDSTGFTDWIPYMFMINATNPRDLTTSAFSDPFTIFNNDGPVVYFTAPEENETLTGEFEIRWESWDDFDETSDLYFTLYYRSADDLHWYELALKQPNIGSFAWDTREAVFGDGDYMFRLALNDSSGGISEPVFLNFSIYNPDAPVVKWLNGPREQVREGTAEFRWGVEDPDKGETGDITFDVFISSGGESWLPFSDDMPNEDKYVLDVSEFDDNIYDVKFVFFDNQPGNFSRSVE